MAKLGEPEPPSDLSLLPRAQLIRGGMEAIAKGSSGDARHFFGAAIRKATRVRLWDIEAEFHKFVTLYLDGDYPEAVNRCLECLDGVKMMSDIARSQGVTLPRDAVGDKLAECLIQTMVMRRDSLWRMIGHFWHLHQGEYFLMKRKYGFPTAVIMAWMSFSTKFEIRYDLIKQDVMPFTAYLQAQLDAARDLVNGKEENPGAEAEIALDGIHRPAAKPKDEPQESPQERLDFAHQDFLRQAAETTVMGLSNEQLDQLHEICRGSRNVTNLGEVARIIDILGPNSKKSYLAELAKNDLMRSRDSKLPDKDAERLHQEVQEYIDKVESREF